jgi:hypothetical protein
MEVSTVELGITASDVEKTKMTVDNAIQPRHKGRNAGTLGSRLKLDSHLASRPHVVSSRVVMDSPAVICVGTEVKRKIAKGKNNVAFTDDVPLLSLNSSEYTNPSPRNRTWRHVEAADGRRVALMAAFTIVAAHTNICLGWSWISGMGGVQYQKASADDC